MRHAILTTLTALMFGATAHASTLFVDGFEHCRFDPTLDNPIYGPFPTIDAATINWGISAGTLSAVDYVSAPYTGNDCGLTTAANETNTAYVARNVGSINNLYTHASMTMSETVAARNRKIMGNVMSSGDYGCHVGVTPTNDERTQAQIGLFFKDALVEQCDAGSVNPFTPCTSGQNGDDPGRDTSTCAEFNIGEARCNFYPFAVGNIQSDTFTQLSITEQHNAGEVTCGMWVNGRDFGTRSRPAGNCTADNWACSTNADCEVGKCDAGTNFGTVCTTTADCPGGACVKWNGRCSGYTNPETYPSGADDSSVRCRTTADCGGAAGSGTCVTQTCDISDVQPITQTWIGMRDTQTFDGIVTDTTDIVWDDWVASSSSGTGLRKLRIAKFWNIDPGAASVLSGWNSSGCAGADEWDCVDDYGDAGLTPPYRPDDGSTVLTTSSGGSGQINEFEMQSSFLNLSAGTCSGATPPTTPGTCSNLGGKTCFVTSDCVETLSPAGVSVLGVVRDNGEGPMECTAGVDTTASCQDMDQDKQLTFSIYDYSNSSASCSGGLVDCSAGPTYQVNNALGNEYRPAGEATFSTAPDGTAWTVSEIEGLGLSMHGTNQTGGSSLNVTAVLASTVVEQPIDVCVDVLPDTNGDGRITLCLAGDSTYANSALSGLLAADICEPEDILVYSVGGIQTVTILNSIEGIFDGAADAPGLAGFSMKARTVKGENCTAGDCTSCDVTMIGIGLNDTYLRTGIHPETLLPHDENFCWRPGHAQHGQPCICPSKPSSPFEGRCLDCRGSGCFAAGKSAGSSCFAGGITDVCTGNARVGPSGGSCFFETGTCNGSSVCVGNSYWDTEFPGTSCNNNADCLVLANYCSSGACVDAPGCDSPGACIGPLQTSGRVYAIWQQILAAYDTRNGNADPTDDTLLIPVIQPVGDRTYKCLGGVDDGSLCLVNSDCAANLCVGSAHSNITCFNAQDRIIDSHGALVFELAQARGLSWIHHGRCAVTNCPQGLTNTCAYDGIHYSPIGEQVAVDCFRDCLENRNGTSDYHYDCDFTP